MRFYFLLGSHYQYPIPNGSAHNQDGRRYLPVRLGVGNTLVYRTNWCRPLSLTAFTSRSSKLSTINSVGPLSDRLEQVNSHRTMPSNLFIDRTFPSGKTESVKALGVQLGRFMLVFCCDETFDFQAMGRIFIGLCQVGAWGCFDEFNRLEERIRSAVSQQVQTIQQGLVSLAKNPNMEIELFGKSLKLSKNVGTHARFVSFELSKCITIRYQPIQTMLAVPNCLPISPSFSHRASLVQTG